MKTLLIVFIAIYFTACSSGGSAPTESARQMVSVSTFQACQALAGWDKSIIDLQISPTAGSYLGFVFHSDGTTPYITLKADGKAYLEPEYTVNGTLSPLLTNAQFNLNDCTLTMDASGNMTVTQATAPNDQI